MPLRLGDCPGIESLLRQSWIWPYFPMIFVKYTQYSPQITEKSVSNQLSLATASIPGQPPNEKTVAGMIRYQSWRHRLERQF